MINRKTKIGIVTLHGYFNYGNRLQNIAISHFLQQKGYKTYNIVPYNKLKIKNFLFNIKNYHNPIVARQHRIKKETKKIIKETKTKDFDYYFFGSDQIWNYTFLKDDLVYFLGNWVKDKTKIFYISASMAAQNPPFYYQTKFKQYLSNESYISVRETETYLFLKSIGFDSIVVCDPVFLLNLEDWKKLLKYKGPTLKPFIFCYFLGNMLSADDQINIKKYAKLNDLNVINLNDEQFQKTNLSEFIYYVANSEFVLTDSFHAVAFSIIFKKKVQIFKRNKNGEMSQRILSLLENFKIQYEVYENFTRPSLIDCSCATNVDQSIQFLKKQIEFFLKD